MKKPMILLIVLIVIITLGGCSSGFTSTQKLREIMNICKESNGNFYYYTHAFGDEPLCVSKSALTYMHTY